jgi:mono/diheme cytochrome c family protein
VGLGVFLVALRGGGRRRAPDGARRGESRSSRRGFVVVTTVIWIVFGVALPAVVLATNGDNKAKAAPGGVDLTESQRNGRKLFAENCAQCHTLRAVNAVGKVGPNLDELRPPKELVLNAIEQGRARGNGQMPADLVSGTDARDVAEFVAAVAGR